MTTIEQSIAIQAKSNGTITDYKYSPTGQFLAVADSEGYIQVYSRKDAKSYAKINEFRADQGSIWSITWADAKYGNLIGVGSFRNKVAIFQQSGSSWKQIAYHDLHRASVNWVEFAQQGLKLYAGSSDGQISILELSHKTWKSQAFSVGESAIAAFALQQFPLGEIVSEENNQRIYPRIAVVTKDQKIKVWAHESQRLYGQQSQIFDQKSKQVNKSGYVLLRQIATPKQTIRNVLWRPTWGSLSDSLAIIPLITCSEEGYVKSLKLGATSSDNDKIQLILQSEYQVTKISQSLTGNLLTASISNKNQQETYIYQNYDEDEWKNIKKGKI